MARVHDPTRIDFIHRYLCRCAARLTAAGCARLFFTGRCWIILNGARGYNERFGLIYLDYATGKRTPKDSAVWYANVAETNGKNL